MNYTENTRLSEILDDYPWLAEELPRQDPAFEKLNSPAARLLLKRMTLRDASRMSGMRVEALLGELRRLVEKRGRSGVL